MASECAPLQQSWTRHRMDNFHQLDDMRITSYALRYYISPPEANCPSVYPVEPTTRLQKQGNSWPEGKWRTDVETDLKGINRFGSRIRCDDKHYNPETNEFNNAILEDAKDATVPLNFNRLHNPPCTLRSTGWNRWYPLFHDPQATFEQPFDFFIPSRDIDKKLCRNKTYAPTPPVIPGYNSLSDQNKFGSANVEGSEQGKF